MLSACLRLLLKCCGHEDQRGRPCFFLPQPLHLKPKPHKHPCLSRGPGGHLTDGPCVISEGKAGTSLQESQLLRAPCCSTRKPLAPVCAKGSMLSWRGPWASLLLRQERSLSPREGKSLGLCLTDILGKIPGYHTKAQYIHYLI